MRTSSLWLVLAACSSAAFAPVLVRGDATPSTPVPPEFAAFEKFVGTWKGDTTGKFGPAKVHTTYAWCLNKKFLQTHTTSKGKKDVHEDQGMLSYDKARKQHILRDFHSEGYANRYTVDVSDDGKKFVFVSEAVENGFAPGLRVKQEVVFVSDDEHHLTFCLATKGKPWNECFKTVLKRQKSKASKSKARSKR